MIKERVADIIAQTWMEPLRSASSASEGIVAVFDLVAASLDSNRAVSFAVEFEDKDRIPVPFASK